MDLEKNNPPNRRLCEDTDNGEFETLVNQK